MGQASSRPAYRSAASNEVSQRKSLGGLTLIAGGASGYMVAGLKGITR
jgi:hypothetical protein